jgi:hypothetical protein
VPLIKSFTVWSKQHEVLSLAKVQILFGSNMVSFSKFSNKNQKKKKRKRRKRRKGPGGSF